MFADVFFLVIDTCTMEKSVCVESMSASWTDAPILQNISFKVDDVSLRVSSYSWNSSTILSFWFVFYGLFLLLTQNFPLLAVVGSVGAGKVNSGVIIIWNLLYTDIYMYMQSTLLQVLLSELQPSSGRVNINGRLSYTSQEPWLFSASLRDNILFGNEYDPVRYNAVIDACALKKVKSCNL